MLGKNHPVRADWTDIKSKYTTPKDEKRVLVITCPTFVISETNLEENLRSTDDSSEKVGKSMWLEKVKLHEPTEAMAVEKKIILENTDSDKDRKSTFCKNYPIFEANLAIENVTKDEKLGIKAPNLNVGDSGSGSEDKNKVNMLDGNVRDDKFVSSMDKNIFRYCFVLP